MISKKGNHTDITAIPDQTGNDDDLSRQKKVDILKKMIAKGDYPSKAQELAEKIVQYLTDNNICKMPPHR